MPACPRGRGPSARATCSRHCRAVCSGTPICGVRSPPVIPGYMSVFPHSDSASRCSLSSSLLCGSPCFATLTLCGDRSPTRGPGLRARALPAPHNLCVPLIFFPPLACAGAVAILRKMSSFWVVVVTASGLWRSALSIPFLVMLWLALLRVWYPFTTGFGATSFSPFECGMLLVVRMHVRVSSLVALCGTPSLPVRSSTKPCNNVFTRGASGMRFLCCFCWFPHSAGIAIFDAVVHGFLSWSFVLVVWCIVLGSICVRCGLSSSAYQKFTPSGLPCALLVQCGLHCSFKLACMEFHARSIYSSASLLFRALGVCSVHPTIWWVAFTCSWWFLDMHGLQDSVCSRGLPAACHCACAAM